MLGVQKGDRVGILAPNCVEWIIVQYATARAGFIMVSLQYSSLICMGAGTMSLRGSTDQASWPPIFCVPDLRVWFNLFVVSEFSYSYHWIYRLWQFLHTPEYFYATPCTGCANKNNPIGKIYISTIVDYFKTEFIVLQRTIQDAYAANFVTIFGLILKLQLFELKKYISLNEQVRQYFSDICWCFLMSKCE